MNEYFVERMKAKMNEGPSISEINGIIEKHLNRRDINLENNSYWIGVIENSIKHNKNIDDILYREKRINSVTPEIVQSMIKKHFPIHRNTIITLMPEE